MFIWSAAMPIPLSMKTGLVKKSLLILPLLALFSACGSDFDALDPGTKRLYIDFNDGASGWQAGFAEYPAGQETLYQLSYGWETLPATLGSNRKGFKLSGSNHSDDLYMFITKKIDGLEANSRYDFRFKLSFGTNAQKNCMGVGGAPGESVWIKVGAGKTEPKAIDTGAGNLLMNIDKGQQATGGSDAIVIGNFANERECGNADTSYMQKTLLSEAGTFSGITDAQGNVWLLLSTDSGFEAITTIYFMELEVTATKQ
jgi:hypothetical protein